MGTNYYIKADPPCKCCGRPFEDVHIGKLSQGWRFMFSTAVGRTVEKAMATIVAADGLGIVDEYGEDVSASALIRQIEESASGKSHFEYCRVHHPEHAASVLHEDGGFTFIDTEFS